MTFQKKYRCHQVPTTSINKNNANRIASHDLFVSHTTCHCLSIWPNKVCTKCVCGCLSRKRCDSYLHTNKHSHNHTRSRLHTYNHWQNAKLLILNVTINAVDTSIYMLKITTTARANKQTDKQIFKSATKRECDEKQSPTTVRECHLYIF